MSGMPKFESLEPRQLMSGSIISNAALIGLIDAPSGLGQWAQSTVMPLGESPSWGQLLRNGPVTVPHREQCRGTFIDVQPGFLSYRGSGVATHFGRYSIIGSNNLDDQGNVLNGQFTTTAADGSTISGVYAGTYTLLGGTKVRFDVEVQWLQGTGRLTGVTGQASVVAVADVIAPGAAFDYSTQGHLTFPT